MEISTVLILNCVFLLLQKLFMIENILSVGAFELQEEERRASKEIYFSLKCLNNSVHLFLRQDISVPFSRVSAALKWLSKK